MRAFITFLVIVGALSATCPTPNPDCPQLVCGNSALTPLQLKGILQSALTKLATFSIANPNMFIPNYNPTQCQHSMTQGSLVGCGYTTVFAGANQTAGNPTWSGLFDNPDVWYGSLYTGTSCFSSLADIKFPDDFGFKLRDDEAIIWLGCTPNQATYYSFNRAVINRTDTQKVYGLLGESVNELTANTASNTATPTKFGAATLLIYAADQDVADAIINAFTSSGFPSTAINVDPWPVAEVNLGTNGQINSQTSLLTFVNRIYKFASQSAQGYALCASQFPFIRLTPVFPRICNKPIAKMESWHPDDVGIMYGSEFGFLPVLQGLVQTITGYTNSSVTNPLAGGWKLASSFVSQPFRLKDIALKWILENRFGAFGTKDAAYNAFPIQLSQAYSFNQTSLAFSAVCGLDHTKNFSTNIPQLFHIPTATYFNYAVYGINPTNGGSAVGRDSGLAAGITTITPLNIAAFPAPVQAALSAVFAKPGVATAQNFYCNYFSSNCAALAVVFSALPCTQVNTSIPFGTQTMAHLFRAYLNPSTRTASSEVTLLTPFLMTFTYTK